MTEPTIAVGMTDGTITRGPRPRCACGALVTHVLSRIDGSTVYPQYKIVGEYPQPPAPTATLPLPTRPASPGEGHEKGGVEGEVVEPRDRPGAPLLATRPASASRSPTWTRSRAPCAR
jgi:hypothetical protein